ncbi:MAG: hypothetical protein ABEJ98_03450 [Candidatus Nanohaloarchaea archaeon]
MDIVEEAVRRRDTIALADPERAYPELKDLLERRMDFDTVREPKYYHDVDSGNVRSRIEAEVGFDKHTRGEIDIFLFIDAADGELDIQVKGKVVTSYGDGKYDDALWYYGYRALYDKFVYGSVREQMKPEVEEKVEELLTRVRKSVS